MRYQRYVVSGFVPRKSVVEFQVIPADLCTAANLVPFHASWGHSPGMGGVLAVQAEVWNIFLDENMALW